MTSIVRAVLLDLDDTVIDYTGSSDACWREVCAEVATEVRVEADLLHAAIMRTRAWFWQDPVRNRDGRSNLLAASRQIVELALHALDVDDSALAIWMADTYRERRDTAISLFPDALATIEALRDRGMRLALVTNGSAALQRAKIDRFDLARHFESILIEGDLGFGKPDERVYHRALEMLDVDARESMMVGDHLEIDVVGAQRLGIRGVWLDRAGLGIPEGTVVRPDRSVASLAEVLEQLDAPCTTT